jgi:hypothetical protein
MSDCEIATCSKAQWNTTTTCLWNRCLSIACIKGSGTSRIAREDHPFVDGNKRTGVLASFVFVELNGFEFEATNDDVVDTVITLIVRDIEFNELVTRFESWLRPI